MFGKKTDVSAEDIEQILGVFRKLDPRSLWSRVATQDFTVRRFEHGDVNDISCCELTDEATQRLGPLTDNDARAVVVKFFFAGPFFHQSPIEKAVINSVASSAGVSPHLIYIDDVCCVHECVRNARQPGQEDDADEEFFEHTARHIARFHSMQVPVNGQILEEWFKFMDSCKTNFPGAPKVMSREYLDLILQNPEIRDLQPELAKINFKNLFDLFPKALPMVKSPIVFSHMDWQWENRLVGDSVDSITGKVTKQLFSIDLDFSCYNYRGYDLGNFIATCGNPRTQFPVGELIEDSRIRKFAHFYREECGRIYGDSYLNNPENDAERIFNEIRVFVLYYYFLTMFLCVSKFCQDSQAPKAVEFIRNAHQRAQLFQILKRRLQQESIFPDVGISI